MTGGLSCLLYTCNTACEFLGLGACRIVVVVVVVVVVAFCHRTRTVAVVAAVVVAVVLPDVVYMTGISL